MFRYFAVVVALVASAHAFATTPGQNPDFDAFFQLYAQGHKPDLAEFQRSFVLTQGRYGVASIYGSEDSMGLGVYAYDTLNGPQFIATIHAATSGTPAQIVMNAAVCDAAEYRLDFSLPSDIVLRQKVTADQYYPHDNSVTLAAFDIFLREATAKDGKKYLLTADVCRAAAGCRFSDGTIAFGDIVWYGYFNLASKVVPTFDASHPEQMQCQYKWITADAADQILNAADPLDQLGEDRGLPPRVGGQAAEPTIGSAVVFVPAGGTTPETGTYLGGGIYQPSNGGSPVPGAYAP